jgi:hypothetical protein
MTHHIIGGKELSTTGRPITLPLVHRRNERPKASLWRLVHRSFEKVGYFSLRMAWDLSNVVSMWMSIGEYRYSLALFSGIQHIMCQIVQMLWQYIVLNNDID